jgi:hypothetical protein
VAARHWTKPLLTLTPKRIFSFGETSIPQIGQNGKIILNPGSFPKPL